MSWRDSGEKLTQRRRDAEERRELQKQAKPLRAFASLRLCVNFSPMLILGVVALILAACGSPKVQPLILNPEPWADGETSVYRIIDRKGEPAGTMSIFLEYGPLRSGEEGWTVRREIDAQGETEIAAVEAIPDRLLPQHAMLVRTSPDGTERVETTYDGGQIDMRLTTARNNTTYQRTTAPSDARDQRTTLLLARMLPLAKGYATRFNSFLPVAERLDRVILRVLKREEVTVPAGTFDAWLVELDTGDSKTKAWIGVDPPHPLVKYVDGRNGATFELVE